MWDAELERQRKVLHEAFMAGWQAATGVRVTNPAVQTVIETCFELWLEEEVDERHVLGLPFKRRYDLPRPGRRTRPELAPAVSTSEVLTASDGWDREVTAAVVDGHLVEATVVELDIPRQRRSRTSVED
jgi:hypothetical protein